MRPLRPLRPAALLPLALLALLARGGPLPSPPPPSPPRPSPPAAADDPCGAAPQSECALTPAFCLQACAWNMSAQPAPRCEQVDRYPPPPNASRTALVGQGGPLATNFVTVSFYGDSLTFAGGGAGGGCGAADGSGGAAAGCSYTDLLAAAVAGSVWVGNVRVVNQGVRGATLRDLIEGHSPAGGHLNPYVGERTNATFLQTLEADRPSFVAIQVGLEDVRQAGKSCGARCSNVSEFVRLFTERIIAPLVERNIPAAIVSVGLDGECTDEGNALDEVLNAYADAQLAMAFSHGLAFVDMRTAAIDYENAFNCLNLTQGPLTTDGVLPNERGTALLAESVASGMLDAIKAPLPPGPPPRPTGGRIWLTSAAYNISGAPGGGVAAADAACTLEAGGAPARALIADVAGCGGQPCRRASVTPWRGDGQIDWPLVRFPPPPAPAKWWREGESPAACAARTHRRPTAPRPSPLAPPLSATCAAPQEPNRLYFMLDNETAVGFTDATGLLGYPLFAGPAGADACAAQATGMSADWTTRAGPGGTCDSWSNASATLDDAGLACSRLPRLIGSASGSSGFGNSSSSCASLFFLCVAGV